MKRLILILVGCLASLVLLQSFQGYGKRDGTEPGYTGSPGDSLRNCTACHGGTPQRVVGWITSDIPQAGYTPGERYTIRAVNTEWGATRFGFSISPQALNGQLLGSMIVTDTLRTKLVGSDKYITYRADGVDGVDSNVWEFDWVAPAAGTGDVVFYGAFNSNHEGHKDGDHTYLDQLRVNELGVAGLFDAQGAVRVQTYPNPATTELHIDLSSLPISEQPELALYTLAGNRCAVSIRQQYHNVVMDVAQLPSGIYLLQVRSGNQSGYQKVMIQ